MHSRMIEYMKTIVHFETRHELENGGVSNAKYMSTALPLSWHSSATDLSKTLLQAKLMAQNYLSTHSLSLLKYETFGKLVLKELHVSPDSFIQMVLQLAFYRDQQRFTATYETGTTRAFYHVSL